MDSHTRQKNLDFPSSTLTIQQIRQAAKKAFAKTNCGAIAVEIDGHRTIVHSVGQCVRLIRRAIPDGRLRWGQVKIGILEKESR